MAEKYTVYTIICTHVSLRLSTGSWVDFFLDRFQLPLPRHYEYFGEILLNYQNKSYIKESYNQDTHMLLM